jgi:hypothetical protein
MILLNFASWQDQVMALFSNLQPLANRMVLQSAELLKVFQQTFQLIFR